MLKIVLSLMMIGIIFLNHSSFSSLLWSSRPSSIKEVFKRIFSLDLISFSFLELILIIILFTIAIAYRFIRTNNINFSDCKKTIIGVSLSNAIISSIVIVINYIPLLISYMIEFHIINGNLNLILKVAGLIPVIIFEFIIPIKLADRLSCRVEEKLTKEKEKQEYIEKNKKDKLSRKLISSHISEWKIHNLKFSEKKLYIFNSGLGLKTKNVKEIYLNNDQKFKYYKDMFNSLNKSFNGDYRKYIDSLISRGQDVTRRLGYISQETKCIKNFKDLHKSNINTLSQYFNFRNKFIFEDFNGCRSGIEGENSINKELSLYTNIINLRNIRLEVEDIEGKVQSIENDNILLTRNGIFVLEVKNFGDIGNYDIIIEKDGRWLRKNRSNNKISVLKNVTKQNNRHIGFLNKFINESTNREFDNYIEVTGIVVLANEKVKIENFNDNQKVFRESELYSYITTKPAILMKEELDEIEKILLENNLPPKKYPIPDYHSEIYNNIINLKRYIVNCEKLLNLLEENYKEYFLKENLI